MSPYFEYLNSPDVKRMVDVMQAQPLDAPSAWHIIGYAPFHVALAMHDPFITESGFPHAPCFSALAMRPR